MTAQPLIYAPTRRRVLTIAAAACVATTARHVLADDSSATYEWRGTALGAPARLILAHSERRKAKAAAQAAMGELERIEDEFSLYRDRSALSRLNRDGVLNAPSLDMLHLLRLARHVSDISGGAFDVSMQPLWSLYAAHISARPNDIDGPAPEIIAHSLQLVDYRKIRIGDTAITLNDGMALSFNGIAQGYTTDRVTAILRSHGFSNVLVDMGETYGAGHNAYGAPWRVALSDTISSRTVALDNRALAVSSRSGTVLDPAGQFSHMFDPASGHPMPRAQADGASTIYVTHPSAAMADALSTALCVARPAHAKRIIGAIGGAQAFSIDPAGVHHQLG